MVEGRVAGTVTSGDWGHRIGKNLAYAFVEPELSAIGTSVTIDMLGDIIPATVINPSPYDPHNEQVRA